MPQGTALRSDTQLGFPRLGDIASQLVIVIGNHDVGKFQPARFGDGAQFERDVSLPKPGQQPGGRVNVEGSDAFHKVCMSKVIEGEVALWNAHKVSLWGTTV